ncbi:unnamed protein product [Cylicostephanus goldi]|uniref:Uncharacterized protein n=1 Tax=Cylicostephanus goldi TaxID=71465 RepID=A0A3P6S6P0_CYLGO|nr:unnamed protein product [Cylicostephanus goldi]
MLATLHASKFSSFSSNPNPPAPVEELNEDYAADYEEDLPSPSKDEPSFPMLAISLPPASVVESPEPSPPQAVPPPKKFPFASSGGFSKRVQTTMETTVPPTTRPTTRPTSTTVRTTTKPRPKTTRTYDVVETDRKVLPEPLVKHIFLKRPLSEKTSKSGRFAYR